MTKRLSFLLLLCSLVACQHANTYTVIESKVGTDPAYSDQHAKYVIRQGNVLIHARCDVVVVAKPQSGLAVCPNHPDVPIGVPLTMKPSDSGDSLKWETPQGSIIFLIESENASN